MAEVVCREPSSLWGGGGRPFAGVGLPPFEEEFEIFVRPRERADEDELVRLTPSELSQGVDVSSLLPVRNVHRGWAHQRGRVTLMPLHHLPGEARVCESRFEAVRILELVFRQEVTDIATQPMRVHRLGDSGSGEVPDLLYETVDGELVLENVRPVEKRDEAFMRSCERLSRFAKEVGWTFVVSGESVEEFGETIEYLSCYARVPVQRDLRQRVQRAFRERRVWPFAELLEACAEDDPVAHASLMAMMWRRELTFSLRDGIHPGALLTLRTVSA
ncbi:MAG: hypothetical protein ROY82_08665 [Truepera sp.]|nr:hypothetical protein [Truepera sp.]